MTEYVEQPEKIKDALVETVADMVDSAEAKAAAKVHLELRDRTRRTRDELEDYLLVHHIPGRCRLCKKLGGQ